MNGEPICPCEGLDHPRAVDNPPGRSAITYRVGDFGSFREALLRPRPGERDLAGYHPSAKSDLALQMLEWWAYLADVLTFYNERIADASYLGTAVFDDEIARLVRLLGYRPRPGIGAVATLGALVSAPRSITLPAGLPIQSKPGPGQEPQVFELDRETTVGPGGAIPADPVNGPRIAERQEFLVQGAIATIKPGDDLLLTVKDKPTVVVAVVHVKEVAPAPEARGRPRTRVKLEKPLDAGLAGDVDKYRLLRGDATTGLYAYRSNITIDLLAKEIHLASIVRSIQVGDPILLESSGGKRAAKVERYKETVWFARPLNEATPDKPDPNDKVPAPIFHSVLGLDIELLPLRTIDSSQLLVRYGFRDLGALIAEDSRLPLKGRSLKLRPVAPARFTSAVGDRVLIEDATGAGILAVVRKADDDGLLTVEPEGAAEFSLVPPLRVLTNLIAVSRGATVEREILGSGDASVSGQSFVLQKAPLTYFQATERASGVEYRSTLRVLVNDVAWTEVPSFYGQPPDAQVFITREDEAQRTHVLFGDGVNGARLPTGVDNVVASYRYGSGARAPDAGALVTLLTSFPGLSAVRNPVEAGGGDDPAPGSAMRRYAPRTALALGRAVSADDYEAIAALAPGVARARAEVAWDAEHQRSAVTVWVGDNDDAKKAAKAAIAAVADPTRPFRVEVATPVPLEMSLTVVRDARHDDQAVKAGVKRALADADTGLIGIRRARIGAALYVSQIHEAALRVPGVVAVHALALGIVKKDGPVNLGAGPRYAPGEGRFFTLSADKLNVSTEVATDAL